jgi:hypothetical protein
MLHTPAQARQFFEDKIVQQARDSVLCSADEFDAEMVRIGAGVDCGRRSRGVPGRHNLR